LIRASSPIMTMTSWVFDRKLAERFAHPDGESTAASKTAYGRGKIRDRRQRNLELRLRWPGGARG
jgi:hypothetical protein